jgi:hypothetical protein
MVSPNALLRTPSRRFFEEFFFCFVLVVWEASDRQVGMEI